MCRSGKLGESISPVCGDPVTDAISMYVIGVLGCNVLSVN